MLGTSASAQAAARRVVKYKKELDVHVYVARKRDRRLTRKREATAGRRGNHSEFILEILARRVLRSFGRTGFKEHHDIVYDKIIEAGCLRYADGFDVQDILFLQNIRRDEQ
jgi:hypothetical protein